MTSSLLDANVTDDVDTMLLVPRPLCDNCLVPLLLLLGYLVLPYLLLVTAAETSLPRNRT